MEKQIEAILRGGQFKNLFDKQIAGLRESYNLRKIDIEIIYYLSKCGEYNTSKDIRQYLMMNKGFISQSMEELCKRGYTRAIPDREDRRYIHYELTEKADDIVQEMAECWNRMSEILFRGITKEEQELFKNIAQRIRRNMDAMVKD